MTLVIKHDLNKVKKSKTLAGIIWFGRGSGLPHRYRRIQSSTWQITEVSKASNTSGTPVVSVSSLQHLGVGGAVSPPMGLRGEAPENFAFLPSMVVRKVHLGKF